MSLEMAPLDKSHTSSYSSSVVTMALSCIVSEIKRDIGSKIAIFHTPYTKAPTPVGNRLRMFCVVLFTTKVNGQNVMQNWEKFNLQVGAPTLQTTDRRTDDIAMTIAERNS